MIVPCGLFDINMRTIDSERSGFIQEHGWRPLTPPIWQFGDNAVKEFLAVQADGIVSIVERVSPATRAAYGSYEPCL